MAEKIKLTDCLSFDEKDTPKLAIPVGALVDHSPAGKETVIRDGHLLILEPMISIRRAPLIEVTQTISALQAQVAEATAKIAELQALQSDIIAGKIAEIAKVK